MHPTVAYSTEHIDIWFARGLAQGARQLDAGEHLDVLTATAAQLFAWCRDGVVTDAKTLVGALWLNQWQAGQWPLDWRAAPHWAGAGGVLPVKTAP